MLRANRFVAVVLFGWATLALSPYATAQARFFSASELPEDPTAVEVLGARPLTASDFPASFYHLLPHGKFCSATLVGPGAVVTAAHCVADRSIMYIKHGDWRAQGECRQHKAYAQGNRSADIALCAVSPFAQIPGERVANVPLLSQSTVLLTGYGCVKSKDVPEGGAPEPQKSLFGGEAIVVDLPVGDNFHFTSAGQAVLCFGDSGGATFVVAGNSRRLLVGANAASDFFTRSAVTALYAPGIADFINDWADKHGRKICGLHADAVPCREAP